MKAAIPLLIVTELKKPTVINIQISSILNSGLMSENSIRKFTKNPAYCDFQIECPISELNFTTLHDI